MYLFLCLHLLIVCWLFIYIYIYLYIYIYIYLHLYFYLCISIYLSIYLSIYIYIYIYIYIHHPSIYQCFPHQKPSPVNDHSFNWLSFSHLRIWHFYLEISPVLTYSHLTNVSNSKYDRILCYIRIPDSLVCFINFINIYLGRIQHLFKHLR